MSDIHDVRIEIPTEFTDEQAEEIGEAIATDFGLKRSSLHPDRWETESGTYTNKGIARRTVRHIQDVLFKQACRRSKI